MKADLYRKLAQAFTLFAEYASYEATMPALFVHANGRIASGPDPGRLPPHAVAAIEKLGWEADYRAEYFFWTGTR